MAHDAVPASAECVADLLIEAESTVGLPAPLDCGKGGRFDLAAAALGDGIPELALADRHRPALPVGVAPHRRMDTDRAAQGEHRPGQPARELGRIGIGAGCEDEALLSEPDRTLEESWAGARLLVGVGRAVGEITLADGRVVPTGSGISGSFVLPFRSSVGWEVPIGGQSTFVFGAPLRFDVAEAAELFADAAHPDDIAEALGAAWGRHRSVR